VTRARATITAGIAASVVAAAVGCASQGMPPGGPPDTMPPKLVRVTPDSGSVNASPRAVRFLFDEVVSERPRGAATLDQLVIISPSDGPPDVSWDRNAIVVRPRRGWRPGTAYAVTILPGLTDLRGNAAPNGFRTVFATGAAIPTGTVSGAVFDWMAGKPAPQARIEATVGGDTTFRYVSAADSSGRYTLGTLPPRTYVVRGYIDQNNNGTRDTREVWDSVVVAVTDSARHDLYLFMHDTIGARMADVTIADSTTIRVKFDRGLRGGDPLTLAQVRLIRARDSAAVRVALVMPAGRYDTLLTQRKASHDDSVARADTSEAGRAARARDDSVRRQRVRDSVSRAQQDSLRAARDTVRRVPPPVLGRPVPYTEFVVVTAEPLPEEVPLRLAVRDVQALVGPARSSDRLVVRRKPTPKDSTATKQRRPPGAP
jgi:hypothetical protein